MQLRARHVTSWGVASILSVVLLVAAPVAVQASSHNSKTFRTCEQWSDADVWYTNGLRNYRYGGLIHACGGNLTDVWWFRLYVSQIDNVPNLNFVTYTWTNVPQHGNWVGVTWCRFESRGTGVKEHRMFCRYYRA